VNRETQQQILGSPVQRSRWPAPPALQPLQLPTMINDIAANSDLLVSALSVFQRLLRDHSLLTDKELDEALELCRALHDSAQAEIPATQLAALCKENIESVQSAAIEHLDQLGVDVTARTPYSAGNSTEIWNRYGARNLVILPYSFDNPCFQTVSNAKNGTTIVVWFYWDCNVWLVIDQEHLRISVRANSNSFPSIRFDQIFWALIVYAYRLRNKGLVVPALFLTHSHIGHHIWHELNPSLEFPTIAAGRSSPPGAMANVELMLSHSTNAISREIQHFNSFGDGFYAAFAAASHFNMVPSKAGLIASRVGKLVFDDMRKRIETAPPAFLGVNDCGDSDWRGNPNSNSILFSLRCGNRMLTTTEAFFAALIQLLAERTSINKIYITGFNSDFGGSAFAEFCAQNPNLDELELSERLSATLSEKIEIVNLVGAPVLDDLIAASTSRAVVSPWGASLAKYSWLLRVPVISFTNNDIFSNKTGERDLYSNPAYAQEAGSVHWVEDVPIQDEEDSGLHWLWGRANYTIDPLLLAEKVTNILLTLNSQ